MCVHALEEFHVYIYVSTSPWAWSASFWTLYAQQQEIWAPGTCHLARGKRPHGGKHVSLMGLRVGRMLKVLGIGTCQQLLGY